MHIVTAVADIISRAQKLYLNDPTGSTYTATVLMPFINDAYEDFQLELELNDISNKHKVAPNKTILAGETQYLPLPSDFLWPIKIEEKKPTDENHMFEPMQQREDEKNTTPATSLLYWAFRLDGIYFADATEDRDVRLYYKPMFPILNDDQDNVYGRAANYLSAKISATAHALIGQNLTLAELCNNKAEEQLRKLIKIYVKCSMAIPSTSLPRKSYGW